MVKIPIYENERSVDTGQGSLRLISDEGGSKVGAGLKKLGAGLDDIGDALFKIQRRNDTFFAEKAVLDWEERASRYIDEQRTNQMPEDGRGFHKKVLEEITVDGANTLNSIPKSVRQKYELKLQGLINTKSDQIAAAEIQQTKAWIGGITKQKLDNLSMSVSKGLLSKDDAIKEADDFIKASGVEGEKSITLFNAMAKDIESAALGRMRETDPVNFTRDASKLLGQVGSKNATPIQSLIVESSRAHGVDPTTMLAIAKIESDFNPNAGAVPGSGFTMAGVFQLSKTLRKKYGIPEESKNDPALASAAMAKELQWHTKRLQANGLPVDTETLWASHFLGPGGMLAVYKSDPNTNFFEAYASVAGVDIARKAMANNGRLLAGNPTTGEVIERIRSKVRGAVSNVQGLTKVDDGAHPNTPLAIMGEGFKFLTVGDIRRDYLAGLETIQKTNDQIISALHANKVKDNRGNPFDPDDRKAIDEAADRTGLVDGILKGDAAAFQAVQQETRARGYLPAPYAQAALKHMTSADPTTRSLGFEVLSVAHAANTHNLELAKVPSELKKQIEQYEALRSVYKLDPAEASERVRKINSEEARAKRAKIDEKTLKAQADLITWNEISSQFDLTGWQATPWFRYNQAPVSPEAQKSIVERAQAQFKYHYEATGGDVQTTKALMFKDISRTHGLTTVTPDGKPRFMLFPPERNLPPGPDGTHNYVKEQVSEQFRLHLESLARSTADPSLADRIRKTDQKNIHLEGTADTGRDIYAGRPPRYNLFYLDHTGRVQTVITPVTLDPSRARKTEISTPYGIAPDRIESPTEQKPDLGKLRDKRKAETEESSERVKDLTSGPSGRRGSSPVVPLNPAFQR